MKSYSPQNPPSEIYLAANLEKGVDLWPALGVARGPARRDARLYWTRSIGTSSAVVDLGRYNGGSDRHRCKHSPNPWGITIMSDDWKHDYEEVKNSFQGMGWKTFKSGGWFSKFLSETLMRYSERVDGNYIRQRYPGARPADQARKVIDLAVKHCGWAGGLTATAATGAELATLGSAGSSSPVTLPAIAVSIMADVGYTARAIVRATYDLSVVHRAPLSASDHEDCTLILA